MRCDRRFLSRRRLIAVGTTAMFSVLAVGCGATPTPPSPPPPTQAPAPASPPSATSAPTVPSTPSAAPATAPTVVPSAVASPATKFAGQKVVYGYKDPGAGRMPVFQDMVAKCRVATGIDVEWRPSPDSTYWEKLQLEAAGGGAPDVTNNQVNWVQPGAARGLFVELDSYMQRDGIKRDEYNDWQSWLYNGKLYGLPYLFAGENFFVNKKLFQDMGVQIPSNDWTWDDLLKIATGMTKGDGPTKQYGLLNNLDISENFGTFVLNNAGKVLNDERDKALWGDDPKAIEAGHWVADTMLKTKIAPTPALLQGQPDAFQAGRVALSNDGLWGLPNNQKALGTENVGLLPPPKGPTGLHTASVGSNAYSLVGSSKVKDAAWEVLKWFCGEEGQTIYAKLGTPGLIKVTTAPQFLSTYGDLANEVKYLLDYWHANGRGYFITIDCDEWWKAAGNALDPMWVGEKTVPDAMKSSADAVNAVFAKRPKT